MGVIFTDKEQNEIALMNVSYYDSKAEYMADTFADVTKESGKAVFNEQLESGFIQDITCGTYNGATNDFTPWELTDNNILDMIFIALNEDYFYDFVAMYSEELLGPDELEQWSNADWIREYTEVFEVFIIDGRVYVFQD